VGKAGVVAVSTAQYKDERSSVGRIIVALEGPRRYEVAPRGDALVVRVIGEAAQDRQAPILAAASGAAKPTATPSAPPTAPATPTPTPGATQGAPSDRSGAADEHVVSRRVDEAVVGRPARAITGVRSTKDRIVLVTNGQVSRIEVIELRDPARLALDLDGVVKAPKAPVRGPKGFAQVRFGRSEGRVRVVLDGAGALPAYEVKRIHDGIAVVASSSTPARTAAAAAAPVPAPAAAAAPRARITDVRFAQQGGFARVEIAGSARHQVSRPDPHTVVLALQNADLAKGLERSLDTTAFQGPVVMISSFHQPTTGEVKIVATLRGEAIDRVEESPKGLSWTFQSTAAKASAAAAVVKTAGEQSAGFASEAPVVALSGAPRAGYSGRRITLDFHDIEIRNLLRLIADVSKKNIVVADDVSGKVTVSLRNVPWDQALDLILKSKGLGKEEMGNVVRIAKYEQIAKEAQARADAEKARAPSLPLKVRLIPVNFARAADVAGRVKDVLSERGSVSTDDRTNVLIVKDVQEALVRAEVLGRNPDTEIPQVLIESRIIEASSNFSKAIGIQWGGNAAFSQTTGNPTGLAFPNNVVGAGGIPGGTTAGTAGTPNFAVSMPAPVGEGAGGAIGLILGSAGGAFNLNLRLSALENKGVVKTISAPKIATIDNKEATIGQGVSIPFSQVSASGVNTTFIEAKLELKVTPHVSADGSILLKIKATNNQPNPQLTGANGQPSISKREAETEVLVKDGETSVIGGIYTRVTSNRRTEVPVLSKLPLLGALFRATSDQDDHTELLIFITPRILNRAATTVAAGTN
jgi:type IV pilus assembly protein PilQ